MLVGDNRTDIPGCSVMLVGDKWTDIPGCCVMLVGDKRTDIPGGSVMWGGDKRTDMQGWGVMVIGDKRTAIQGWTAMGGVRGREWMSVWAVGQMRREEKGRRARVLMVPSVTCAAMSPIMVTTI